MEIIDKVFGTDWSKSRNSQEDQQYSGSNDGMSQFQTFANPRTTQQPYQGYDNQPNKLGGDNYSKATKYSNYLAQPPNYSPIMPQSSSSSIQDTFGAPTYAYGGSSPPSRVGTELNSSNIQYSPGVIQKSSREWGSPGTSSPAAVDQSSVNVSRTEYTTYMAPSRTTYAESTYALPTRTETYVEAIRAKPSASPPVYSTASNIALASVPEASSSTTFYSVSRHAGDTLQSQNTIVYATDSREVPVRRATAADQGYTSTYQFVTKGRETTSTISSEPTFNVSSREWGRPGNRLVTESSNSEYIKRQPTATTTSYNTSNNASWYTTSAYRSVSPTPVQQQQQTYTSSSSPVTWYTPRTYDLTSGDAVNIGDSSLSRAGESLVYGSSQRTSARSMSPSQRTGARSMSPSLGSNVVYGSGYTSTRGGVTAGLYSSDRGVYGSEDRVYGSSTVQRVYGSVSGRTNTVQKVYTSSSGPSLYGSAPTFTGPRITNNEYSRREVALPQTYTSFGTFQTQSRSAYAQGDVRPAESSTYLRSSDTRQLRWDGEQTRY